MTVVPHRFRDVAKTFYALSDFNESTELSRAQHLTVNHVAHTMLSEEALPDIRLELLDAQAQAAVLRFDTENNGLDLLALFHNLRRMLDALGPAQVGDVHQAVDAILNLNEGAEIGEVANAAFNNGAGRVPLREMLPRILHQLLHS